eukprot:CAMPEP_0197186174 /NCGR_PEP_ID=MMETSP1423-20130617/13344_1 /TAXON_ID=476441 /ORGANISM="Pseudo-nitzschia heimii, Strain UNC1101" /LENGTH=693 /DNA_ID=CAMNT_0042637405 /DNA_START=74 /DNA_END=2155 /DNA_ORIENTATION=+
MSVGDGSGKLEDDVTAQMPSVDCCDTGHDGAKNCEQQIAEVLRAAGIESSSMDPSSATFLGELMGYKLQTEHSTRERDTSAAAVKASSGAGNNISGQNRSETQDSEVASVSAAKSEKEAPKILPKSSLAPRSLNQFGEMVTSEATGAAGKPMPTALEPAWPMSSEAVTGVHLDTASRKLSSITRIGPIDGSSRMEEIKPMPLTDEPHSGVSVLRQQLIEQQTATREQSQVLRLLTDHIRELTDTVQALQDSVDRLQSAKVESPPAEASESHAKSVEPEHLVGISARPSFPQAVAETDPNNINNNTSNDFEFNDNNNNNNNNDNDNNNNNNNLRRAHLVAHNVAWRIATFPVRAILFYLKYEYRICVVMYRLAKRDILNPFREAGVIFQLGFVLVILYGRIAPWLEEITNERRKEQEGNGNYDEDNETLLDDSELHIETLMTCIVAGFLWHVGWFGLLYRFFFRDRLHVKIWYDLRDGIEMTPTYGLEFDDLRAHTGEENLGDNNNNVGNNNEINNDDVNEGVDRGDAQNNNVPRRNRGNIENDNGPVAHIANAIGNGVNNFFMGHNRRQQAAEAEEEAFAARTDEAATNDLDGNNHNGGNANAVMDALRNNFILGFVSDILCLLYSFFVSILPGWNYEQQLRDIRNENDRRLRERIHREAESLRNQHEHSEGDSDDASGEESETHSVSEGETD